MKKNRLLWAKERENWTAEEWGRIVFSDESKFNLIGCDSGVRVRRRAGERYHEECLQPTVKHSPYVMVWGAITKTGVGEIVLLESTVNSTVYKDIIREGVLPTMEQLSDSVENPIFQDDSAPCHRSKTVSIG